MPPFRVRRDGTDDARVFGVFDQETTVRADFCKWAGVGPHQAELVELTVLGGEWELPEMGLSETSQKVSYGPLWALSMSSSHRLHAQDCCLPCCAVLDCR